ncbi:hypothetical protein BGX31_008242, partial [Mortierella sp. GBA43]
AISNVNLYFLTPCLLFTKIASTITWEQFKTFWPIPIFFLLTSIMAWAVARLGSKVLYFSSDEEKFITASVMFGNANALPIALIQSLALSVAGDRLLRDENDTPEQVAARGISYILFYTIFTNLLRWSYGFSLLVPKDEDDYTLHDDYEVHDEYTARQGNQRIIVVSDTTQHTSTTIPSRSESDEDEDEPELHSHDRLSFFRSAKKDKYRSRSTHLRLFPRSIAESAHQLAQSYKHHRQNSTFTRILKSKKWAAVTEGMRQVLSPPLLTAILALVIGVVPTLHNFFMGPDSKFYSFIIHPIEGCGEGAVPMTLLCLGAQVVHFASASSSDQTSSSGPTSSTGQPETRKRHVSNTHQTGDPMESSSDEDSEDQEYHHVQDSRVDRSGRYWIGSSRSYASSSTTLYNLDHPGGRDGVDGDDDDDWSGSPLYTGSNGLKLKSHRFRWLTPTVYILFSRLILLPSLFLPVILFWPKSWAQMLTEDPAFPLTMVLLVASPTAINLSQLTQVKGFFERDMASVLFWSYCVFGLPCVLLWSLVGLWAAER